MIYPFDNDVLLPFAILLLDPFAFFLRPSEGKIIQGIIRQEYKLFVNKSDKDVVKINANILDY